MNYNSIEEIFSAGITNMTCLINNTKYDDNSYTISDISGFTYKGSEITSINVNGNSYIKFNSNKLCVNNCDGAMYYLYTEEGTLYNKYKFFKIRFSGYSRYSYTSNAYKETYDVIIWDNGSISLHMIDIPTQDNTGTYSLDDVSYTVSTSSPDVTFTWDGSTFSVSNSMIDLSLNYYIIYKSSTKSYYSTDETGNLIYIDNPSSELTSEYFLNYGTNKLPEYSKLQDLAKNSNNLIIFCYNENIDTINSLVVDTTYPLPIIATYEINIPNGKEISKLQILSASDSLLFYFENDDGYFYYDDNNNFIRSDENNVSEGMSANKINNMDATLLYLDSIDSIRVYCIFRSLDETAGRIAVKFIDKEV